MEDEKTADQGRTSRPFLCVLCLISHYYANKIYWRIIGRDSTRPLEAAAKAKRAGGFSIANAAPAPRPRRCTMTWQWLHLEAKKLDPATIFLISDSR